MTPSFLESASFWSNIAVVAFGVLAAIAAAFALYFSSRLGAAKDAELGKFQAESKVAIASADARSAEANQKAAEAGSGTARALVEVASANERAGKLEVEAAHQREKAARAERELLELQERIKPRRLSDTQRTALVDALNRSAVKGLVTINCVLGDADGLAFATQLDNALKAGDGRPLE